MGVMTSQALLQQSLAESLSMRERNRERLHTSDLEDLQAQVDQLRLYVATLFQILVAHGTFTAEEAKALMLKLDATDGKFDGSYSGHDVVTGKDLPPVENPFDNLK